MTLTVTNDLPRFGVKGRAAAGWLTAQGIILPALPNSWLALGEGSRVLRLGRSEYLLEGPAAARLQNAWRGKEPDVFLVPRYDAAFVLSGNKAQPLLREICALDTRPEAIADQVWMTLAAGISVTLISEANTSTPVYRLWCDATYGDYMNQTLQEVLAQPA